MDNEHQLAFGDCVSLFLHSGHDGEWEVKEQYRGKLTYTDEQAPGYLMIGIAVSQVEIH